MATSSRKLSHPSSEISLTLNLFLIFCEQSRSIHLENIMATRKSAVVVAQSTDAIVPARPLALTAGKVVGEAAVATGRNATLFGKAAAISFQGARKVRAAQDDALLAQLRAEYGL
jgi:hypothetical protein